MREKKIRYTFKHVATGNVEQKIYTLSQLEERTVKELSPCFNLGFGYELIGRDDFTGLKDKHGTEIFEGDILKCKCWDKRKSSIDGFDPLGETPYFYRNSVIEWWHSHCNLGYRLRDGKGKTLMIKPSSLNAMEVEVISNIYEHKHLLEETA